MDPVIQVAGIHDIEEAKLAIESGANWLGIPLRLPSGKDDISEEDTKHLIEQLGSQAKFVLITYSSSTEELTSLVKELNFDAVQLHGDISVEEVQALRDMNPSIQILKSLVVKQDNHSQLLSTVREMEDVVDMFLTDIYNPDTGAKGATGLQHDLTVSKKIVESTRKPVIIAGGLNPTNVAEAIAFVRPAGVDAHTGLEGKDGRKDRHLVEKFSEESRRQFKELDEELAEKAVQRSLINASSQGVRGKAITKLVMRAIDSETDNRSQTANFNVMVEVVNAAAQIARSLKPEFFLDSVAKK